MYRKPIRGLRVRVRVRVGYDSTSVRDEGEKCGGDKRQSCDVVINDRHIRCRVDWSVNMVVC